MSSPTFDTHTTLAPGARVVARDEEWLVRRVDALAAGGYAVEVTGLSELVRNHERIFLTTLDEIEELSPESTELVLDDSPRHRRSRLYIESLLRRTPPTDTKIHIGHEGAFRQKTYQLKPVELALQALRPRILIGDSVGLGKTLEVGSLLAELIKRGRGERILVVALKSLLEQFQKELWSRFAIPLVRLDSVGIQRIRTKIPANRNPFTYFDRVIISIDTLKDDGRYRHFLEQCRWDAIVIDECHNVANAGTDRNLLAERLARTTEALLLTSATPHNGRPESFANLMNMLSPTAIADPHDYGPDDIRGLFVRRFKKDVRAEVEDEFRDRNLEMIRLQASAAEEEFFQKLSGATFRNLDGKTKSDALYRSTVLKAFLSSPVACEETLDGRIEAIEKRIEEGNAPDGASNDLETLRDLRTTCVAVTDEHCTKLQRLFDEVARLGYRNSAAKAKKAQRVLLFSERIRTLHWLENRLRERFGLSAEQIKVFHGGLPDVDQQALVESFGNGESPLRILVAGDVASEGVNLHYYCHWLFHFDVPWSLIKLEQRNGRIDRFGQTETPEIRYLLNETRDATTKGDLRIIEKLVEREEWIHRNLGEPGALMGHYSATLEERDVSAAIGRNVDPDEVVPPTPKLDLVKLLTEAQGDATDPSHVVAPRTSLCYDDYAFSRAALDELADELPDEMEIDPDDGTRSLRFIAPPAIEAILQRLPAEALPKHLLFDLSADRMRVQDAIEAARKREGEWPRVQLLWELHPIVQWLTDKVLVSYSRNEAPIVVCKKLAPHDAIFLFQGQVSNKRAQPVVASWFGISLDEHAPVSLEEILERTGLRGQTVNPGATAISAETLARKVGPACDRARAHVRALRAEREVTIAGPLGDELRRLDAWADRAKQGIRGREVELRSKGQLHRPQQERLTREQREIEDRVAESRTWVESTLRTQDRPYIRLVAVFVGPPGGH